MWTQRKRREVATYLHRSQCLTCCVDVFKSHEGLSPHLECFERDNIEDRPELREDGIQRLLEFLFLDFLVEVVDVDRVVWSHVHLAGCQVLFHASEVHSRLQIAGSSKPEV